MSKKKRSYPSVSASWEEEDGEMPHLKKKVSSLFSIRTVQEEEDSLGEDDNSLNGSLSSQQSIGLDLMAKEEEDANEGSANPSSKTKYTKKDSSQPPPSPLSCTEDSSCCEEEEEEEESRNDHDDDNSSSSSLSRTGTNNTQSVALPASLLSSSPVSKTTSTADSSATARVDLPANNNNNNHDVGDFKTGLVFEAGSKHFDRQNRFHKERPLRITSIMDALKKACCTSDNNDGTGIGTLWNRCRVLGEEEHNNNNNNNSSASLLLSSSTSTNHKPIMTMPSISESATRFLNDDDYLRVHLPGYMKRLDKLFDCNCCNNNNNNADNHHQRLDREAEQYKSIYFTKDSLTEAKRAASSLCTLVESVVGGELDNGFAIIRPPGHHAEPGLAGGYCIINNVAVAAAYAKEKLGVQKILIVDWDIHHGNGTQSIFIKDPNVLYFSAHRWHGGNFFPFLSNGGPTNVGMGHGEGRNINVGWTVKGVGDDEYLALWEVMLLPIAKEFQPDLILVSAGFDAARGDLGECDVTPEGYGRLTRDLMTLDVPIVCALEGGYVRSVLGKSVCSVVRALLDRESPNRSRLDYEEDLRYRGGEEDVLNTINATAAKNIKATISAHKPYWRCLD